MWLGVAAACVHEWCGPGTVERGRRCVAAPDDAPPFFLPPSLLCGPGTVERDGVCVVEEGLATCGDGTVLRGDECVSLAEIEVTVPFPAGETVPVMQGMHGAYSHTGLAVNAVDFGVPEGTPIAAVRPGRVVELREDSDSGCADPSCSNLANFLVIDHGDATFDQYWHLQQDGVLVELGELVGAGQVVALSGVTGWASGAHLHFQVRDPLGMSRPLRFVDQRDGEVFAGGQFTSGTDPGPAPAELDWSTCPGDQLSYMGVALDPGAPCSRVVQGRTYRVSGEVLVPDAWVLLGQLHPAEDTWTFTCTKAALGAFDLEVTWPADEYSIRSYLLVAAGAAETCSTYQGWDASIYVALGGF